MRVACFRALCEIAYNYAFIVICMFVIIGNQSRCYDTLSIVVNDAILQTLDFVMVIFFTYECMSTIKLMYAFILSIHQYVISYNDIHQYSNYHFSVLLHHCTCFCDWLKIFLYFDISVYCSYKINVIQCSMNFEKSRMESSRNDKVVFTDENMSDYCADNVAIVRVDCTQCSIEWLVQCLNASCLVKMMQGLLDSLYRIYSGKISLTHCQFVILNYSYLLGVSYYVNAVPYTFV